MGDGVKAMAGQGGAGGDCELGTYGLSPFFSCFSLKPAHGKFFCVDPHVQYI